MSMSASQKVCTTAFAVHLCASEQFRAVSSHSAIAGYVPAITPSDLWMLVGCFVSDQDGNSHADPWADGQRWVDEDWYGCRQKAVDEGSAIFVMEYGQGYAQAGHASCGHMNVINHGNFHVSTDSDAQHFLEVMGGEHAGDTGHNGFGRAPLEDCTGEIDDAGHALGNTACNCLSEG